MVTYRHERLFYLLPSAHAILVRNVEFRFCYTKSDFLEHDVIDPRAHFLTVVKVLTSVLTDNLTFVFIFIITTSAS